MNLIDERNTRTIYRKLRKKEIDERITLSVGKSDRVRLLDEGVVVDACGNPLFYIKKGTLKAYYDSVPDDFEGVINLGHMDFAQFPFVLGTWTKKDLYLVDMGDGRMALDVDLHLDEGSFIVKELRRARYTLGVSSEFTYHVDEEMTEKYELEILDRIFISGFAVVGEAGNVNSSGINFGGGKGMTVQELTAALDGEQNDLEEINKKLDALLEPEEPETEEDPKEEEEEVDEAELAAVEAAIEKIQQENAELKAEVEKLTAQLSAKIKAEKDFVSKFKNLSISLSTERVAEVPEVAEDVFTDGIGA